MSFRIPQASIEKKDRHILARSDEVTKPWDWELDCSNQLLWNLTGTSAAVLPRCLSNFRVIPSLYCPISQLWDFTRSCHKTPIRLVTKGTGGVSPCYSNVYIVCPFGIARPQWVNDITLCTCRVLMSFRMVSLCLSCMWQVPEGLSEKSSWDVAHFLSLAQSKLWPCLANQRSCYICDMISDWLSTVQAHSVRHKRWAQTMAFAMFVTEMWILTARYHC